MAPLFAEYGVPAEHEIENPRNPNHPWSDKVERDPVLQTAENSPTLQTPSFNVEFDGIGYGDSFFCNCMPPDNDGAPGTTQYVQYVNTTYQVFDKKGNTILGPLSGNDFWSGFGGSCQTDNSGDPTIRFDAAAQRWVVNQFAINNSGDDYDCIAVSQTADATGAYNRYAYAFGDFPDYPKLGVWPDAYYLTFNNFNLAGSAFVGANVCAADRASMLAGTSAQLICFQQNGNQFGMLPSDLDGATPPATGTPNFVVELDPDGSANLSMFKFHVDFTTPKNSTFTGPTLIPVPAFTPLCGGGDCVKQPTALSDSLEGLADRLMYRLVYRNFGDHTVLMVNHTITAGNSSGVRWYEIHNPESTPALYQSGTFAPDAQYRWMGGMAMDQAQDIAIGFSRSGSAAGQYPSLVYAGRVPTDTLGTMEGEVTLLAGLGSQSSGGKDRWGDYASVTIDPTDDCTFWFTQEYLKSTGQNGGFNWSTAIGSFNFPGCGGTPNFSLNAIPSSVSVAEGGTATTTVNVVPVNGFTGSVTLSKLSGLPTGVTVGFSPNPTTTSSTLTFTASGTAAKGTSTVTIQGVSGGLTQTAMLNLTVTGGSGGGTVTLTPGSLVWGNVVVGVAGAPTIFTNRPLAEAIAQNLGLPLTQSTTRRFADMELFVEILENVRGEDTFIIQPTSYPANDSLMELLISIDTLRRSSARRITAVVPYYGYARQDRKTGPRTPITAKLVANLITVAGAHRVLTLDLHAGQIQGFFDIPVDNLYVAPVFVRRIRDSLSVHGKLPENLTVVSPDVGGVIRARAMAKRLDGGLAIIDKRREKAGESEVMNIIGDVDGRDCIMLDDIVDSAGTLCNAATALRNAGAQFRHRLCVRTACFSGDAVERVDNSPLRSAHRNGFHRGDASRDRIRRR